MTTTLLVRDLDETTVKVLRERATAAGMSLSSYVAVQLTEMAKHSTNEAVFERARALAHSRDEGPSDEEIIAAIRAGRGE